MFRKPVAIAAVLVGFLGFVPNGFGQFDFLKKLSNHAKEEAKPTKQIAYFKLSGALEETPVAIPPLFGGEPGISLKALLERFKKARKDENVVAIVLDLQNARLGAGQLEELHASLRKFAALDKQVLLHADSLSTGTYAAASGATHISLVPTGDLWLTGLYGEQLYLRAALEKIGATPDFEQCGDFKTATELFMRTGPSPQAEQMHKWLFDGLYGGIVKLIAEGRSMPVEKVRTLIDGGPYSAEEALKLGLIDSVQHRQDFVAALDKKYGEDVEVVADYGKDDDFEVPEENFFAMMEFFMKMLNPKPKEYTEPSVAIVYVDGAIQTGEAERSPFASSEGAFSTTIRKALDEAAEEDSVKAVVLRVDSPGGSALASEIILDASARVAKKKPLIVSMGNVAGSGGYYVTCAAETIFADANTITASIGVLGGKIVTTAMWEKLGVNWHPVQRGKMAAILSSAQKFSEEERAKIRHYMENVYGIFKGHVTEARGKRLQKPIDEIAGGRVFTGTQALELGLVDKIGGLEDAVAFAAKRANLGDYDVRIIPEPPSIFDMFSKHKDEPDLRMRTGSMTTLFRETPTFGGVLPLLEAVDPLRARALLRQLRLLEMIQQEGVIMAMPETVVLP